MAPMSKIQPGLILYEDYYHPGYIMERENMAPLYYFASGTSSVAIDNKIEQAMDLVKSHLMFAVREEVDVLKEKITELMERINQLEYENSILKTHATPETLSKLTWPPNPPST